MNHLKEAMQAMRIDIRDRVLNQAARAATYEAMRWHPGRNAQERYRAEQELLDKYLQLFANYEAALREQNGILLEEISRLRNLFIEPKFLPVDEQEREKWLNGDWKTEIPKRSI